MIRAGFAQYDMGWFYTVWSGLVLHSMIWAVCGRPQCSLKVGNWLRSAESKWETGCDLPSLKVGNQLRSAGTRPDHSCTVACLWTRSFWPKPDQAIQIRSGPVLFNIIQAFIARTETNLMWEFGSDIYNPAQFSLHAGHNCP